MTPVFSVKTTELIRGLPIGSPILERTEMGGFITASNQTVQAVQSCNSWFKTEIVKIEAYLKKFTLPFSAAIIHVFPIPPILMVP